MPIVSTQIIAEAVQQDGRRRYRYRYTFSEGPMREYDRNMTPVGFDPVADAAACIPKIEGRAKNEELNNIYRDVISGKDYATRRDALVFNTVDELEAFILKRTANLLREQTNEQIQADVHRIIAFEIVFQASPARIGGLMGISTGDANGFKGNVNALMIGVTGYAPGAGVPLYPDVGE